MKGTTMGSTDTSHAHGLVKVAGEIPYIDVPAGRATRYQVLIGPEDGAANFILRRFRIEQGGGIPAHTNLVEHEQYVLSGRAEVGIGQEIYTIEVGMALFIPAGATHWYRVIDDPFEFLCIVPNRSDSIQLVTKE